MFQAKLRVRSISQEGKLPDQLQGVFDEAELKELDLSEEELRNLVFE